MNAPDTLPCEAGNDLVPAVDAEQRECRGRAGRLSYYVAGDGPPMLLIHSINAAGSAYEIRPIFEHYRATRRVYAPDLPGFGLSDRSEREYDIRLYADAVLDIIDVCANEHPGKPLDALALSLASEFLARAALETQAPLRSLALITPTGFRRGSERLRGPAGSTREVALIRSIVNVRLWRRGLYRLLTRPGVIRYFLRRTWGSDDIDENLARYDDLTTHQTGAEHAPLAFLSGTLFAGDIRNVYERLELPVWLAHGTRGDFRDFSEAAWTHARDNWAMQRYATGALPHFEQPDRFFEDYSAFLDRIA